MTETLVCSQNALGDLFFALTLSYNLKNNGHSITLFHGSGSYLSSWFPHAKICPYPNSNQAEHDAKTYEKIYVFYDEKSPYVTELVEKAKKIDTNKVIVIYPYPTSYVKTKPYYEDSRINPKIPFLKNIENLLKSKLSIKQVEMTTGFILPENCQINKFKNRIAIHVVSSNPNKDWSIEKFLKLYENLERKGYEPYLLTKEPKYFDAEWKWLLEKGYRAPVFKSLSDLGAFLAESTLVIGVDSGVSHFAASLGVPTVIIGRREQLLRFWSPIWSETCFLCPPKFIPNIRGLRLRDKFWKYFITPSAVEKKVLQTLRKSKGLKSERCFNAVES